MVTFLVHVSLFFHWFGHLIPESPFLFSRFVLVFCGNTKFEKKTTNETNRSCGDEIESAASILIVYDKIIRQGYFLILI